MTGVNVTNPLSLPYQTGSYLIVDNPDGKDNFRSAMSLADRPYRASGSHQLALGGFVEKLAEVAFAFNPARLFLVDLREETHGFVETGNWGQPVSWYADNDWSNVGLSRWLIVEDERSRMVLLGEEGRTRIYTIEADPNDNRRQERQLPLGYQDVQVYAAYTEERSARMLEAELGLPVEYLRIPATDHCAPSIEALQDLDGLATRAGQNDWVHFHCHGGDGRTTTFLALWDILQWEGPLPALTEFAARQYELFPYQIAPVASKGTWKYSLAVERWQALEKFRSER